VSSTYISNVLLVDDDRDVAEVMTGGLQRHGFVVTAFNDPKHALEQYKAKHYGMILLDVRMPGMTGFELAKQIWAKDPDAKIAFFSAFEIYESEAKVMFKDLKSVRFIKKPIAPAELAQIIENATAESK
jgi:DNA-binding NtrC family response regulator